MKSKINFVKLYWENDPLKLENGSLLNEITVAYTTYGKINKEKSNTVLICHALTGDSHAAGELEITDQLISDAPFYSTMKQNQLGWWNDIVGNGKAIDTEKFFVVCSNILGSCYGTTGPSSKALGNGTVYGINFPQITVRDMVRVQKRLIDYLDLKSLHSVVGGSLGGMQALEWAIIYPENVKSIIPIAASAAHSPWAVAYNHIGRNAITKDPAWNNGNYKHCELEGLAIARQIGMISYRTLNSFRLKFGRERTFAKDYYKPENLFQVENYLNYQGNKLVKRFDPNSYIILSRALDLHDVGFGRNGIEPALQSINAKTLCVGIDTDILYPAEEQIEISKLIPSSIYKEIHSIHGHDGFLIETDQLTEIIKPFLENLLRN